MHPPAPAPAESAAFTRTYSGRPDQIRAVRDDLRPLFRDSTVADDAILCASELAANAAQHSNSRLPGGHFTVRATCCPCGHARIEVKDEGGRWTQPARDPSRGRGLDIVHALAAGWGISGDYRTRTFWAYFGDAAPSPAGTSRSKAAILAQARRAGHRGPATDVLDSQRLQQQA